VIKRVLNAIVVSTQIGGLCRFVFLVFVLSCLFGAKTSLALQKLDVCGDPRISCSTALSFEPYDLPFVVKGKVEFREYRSSYFYAVVLKSVKAQNDNGDCAFVSEEERMQVQRLLPTNKVFASHTGCPEHLVIYDGVNADFNFLAVFGGRTRDAAEKVLLRVRSSYPDANIRRMRVIRGIT
jgi:hypothetical protein